MKVYRVSRRVVTAIPSDYQEPVAFFVKRYDADYYAKQYIEGDFTRALIEELYIEEHA